MPVIVLTGSGTWSLPSDWSDANNTIEIYGAGGNGGNGGTSASGGGGGGGGYIRGTNVPLAAAIAAGVVNNLDYGTVGFNTILGNVITGYDEDLNPINSTLLAAYWGSNASGITGGSGGNSAGVDPLGYTYTRLNRTGGLGGNGRASSTAGGGGGGGAAGPNGNGANGGANSTTSGAIGRGGGGANGGTAGSGTSAVAGTGANGGGNGGTGGTTASGSAGSAGTSVYSGGGGGGAADGSATYVGGAGGAYGGGGGGAGATTGSTGGAGAPGIIIITYTAAGQNVLAATEVGSDTAAVNGDVIVKGGLTATEVGSDTAYIASGSRGNLVVTEARDTAQVSGKVIVDGGLDATEGADTAYFSRAKTIVLVPSIGQTSTFTLPGDWSDAGSVIEVYGRGASGSNYPGTGISGGGGGGGAYLRVPGSSYPLKSLLSNGSLTNLNYSDTGTVLGSGYTTFGVHPSGSGIVVQNGGHDSSGLGGAGGSSIYSYASHENSSDVGGYVKFSGGNGGNGRASSAAGGGGGGGGAGYAGNGVNGTNSSSTNGTAGASGGASGGGLAGAGGQGGDDALLIPGRAGQSYGGGGGGAYYATGALGGAGGTGAIVLTYFPTNYMATAEASGDTLAASGFKTVVSPGNFFAFF